MEVADFARANPPLSKPLIGELVTHLHGQHAGLGLVLNWLDQQLAESGQTIEQILQAESQDQAADQVSIGNLITSLRTLTSMDWRAFVVRHSVTEQVLRQDPAGVYAAMAFTACDRYRHVIEDLAKRTGRREQDVAAKAVELAGGEHRRRAQAREGHVGFYLVGPGRKALEQSIGYRPRLRHRLGRTAARRPLIVYLSALLLLGALIATGAAVWAEDAAFWGWGPAVGLGLVIVWALTQPAVAVVNWAVTMLAPPRGLPRMDFSRGIPSEHLTAVAIPSMLTSAGAVTGLLDGLELRYLANRDANLRFVLLTDFPDAGQASMPGDEALLSLATEGIAALNRKYQTAGDMFFLLHRPRLWNAGERVWMGYERKRGKLGALNRLLLTGSGADFSRCVGDLQRLAGVRYVITLDTDTQLPPGSAWRLVGTLAHPLNRPELDGSVVRRGYGVLQPRVAIGLLAAARSRFARLFAGEVGIDPYTREVSNLYQDLAGRSQFIGKGIYDVAAFDAATGKRFPENLILSHDLIEGCFARCGFVNDVELIEEHPASYLADARRRRRWVRGDWQILPWLSLWAPAPGGRASATCWGRWNGG